MAWQGRKTRDKFFSALNTREHNQIDTINLTGSEQWQTIEVAFNSPRVSYRSLRVLATFDNKSANDSEVFVDDFAFIEWQSAFRGINSALPRTGLSHQASYIQLNQPDNNVTLSYQ